MLQAWHAFTPVEQTLLRRALVEGRLAGTVQVHGVELRWAGAAGAPPPRSYTAAEQRPLVPDLAAAAADLADRGLLIVRDEDATVAGDRLRAVLGDAENWLRSSPFEFSAPRAVRDRWFADAYPTADVSGLPGWDELDRDRQEVLVCAAEASGMLTGPWGIGDAAQPDQHLAALLPFVRDGLIEARRFHDEVTGAFTVVGADELRGTLVDPELWRDDLDWGVGLGCVFTHAGLAVWRAGWSKGWSARLSFE